MQTRSHRPFDFVSMVCEWLKDRQMGPDMNFLYKPRSRIFNHDKVDCKIWCNLQERLFVSFTAQNVIFCWRFVIFVRYVGSIRTQKLLRRRAATPSTYTWISMVREHYSVWTRTLMEEVMVYSKRSSLRTLIYKDASHPRIWPNLCWSLYAR